MLFINVYHIEFL